MNLPMMKPDAIHRAPTVPPAERLETAERADLCVRWLKVHGFEVLGVQKGPRNPRITIRTSPLCEKLEGAVRRFERSPYGERRYWVAIRFDCEVRWVEACPRSVSGGAS